LIRYEADWQAVQQAVVIAQMTNSNEPENQTVAYDDAMLTTRLFCLISLCTSNVVSYAGNIPQTPRLLSVQIA